MIDVPFSDMPDARFVVRTAPHRDWFIVDTATGKVTTYRPGGGSMDERYAREVCENLNRVEYRSRLRIEVLNDLLTMTDAGIELDSDALRELIAECRAATEPLGTLLGEGGTA